MPPINEPKNIIIMSLFTNDKDLTAQLEATNAELSELEALLQTREAEIKDLSEKMADLTDRTEVVAKESEETLAAHADMCEQLEASKLALTESQASQEEFNAKVAAAAAAQMAELGVKEPVAQIDEDSETDLYTQYTNLKASNPAAAGAFWRENEAAIKASV